MWVQSRGQEDPLAKGMATHFSILAWRTPWTEKSMGLQRVGHDDEEDPPADEPEPELFLAPKADPNTASGKEQERPDEEYGDELLFLDDGEPEDGAR